jgi:hypothetical protein
MAAAGEAAKSIRSVGSTACRHAQEAVRTQDLPPLKGQRRERNDGPACHPIFDVTSLTALARRE